MPKTLEVLQELTKRCDPCQRLHNAPTRFLVSIGAENIRFNEGILIDFMYHDGKPVLHIVDESTHLGAARFVKEVSTVTLWATMLECWGAIYTGLPRKILVDQGSPFGNLFASIGSLTNEDVQRTGIESHNSLGLGERYHQPLRNTYSKLCIAYLDRDSQLLLSMSVKAINDTLGPHGPVPSALVFRGILSAFKTSESPHPRATIELRAAVENMARCEMEKQMTAVRLQRGLRHATRRCEAASSSRCHILGWTTRASLERDRSREPNR